MRRRLALAVFASAIVVVAGCTRSPADSRSTQAPTVQSPVEQRETGDPDSVTAMSIARKREVLPEGFPFQVPVVDGRVVRVFERDQDGDGVWLYDIEVEAKAADVVAWYESIYTAAEWQLVDKVEETQDGRRAVRLRLVKGSGAESVVRIVDKREGSTVVNGSIGIGVPVNDVY